MRTEVEFSIVHLSDAHLFADPTQEVYGTKPSLNLKAAVHCINAIRPRPSLCVYTGDAVSEECETAYVRFKEQMQYLSIPVHYAVGNHDDRKSLRRYLLDESMPTDDPYYYCFQQSEWRMVVLDTAKPGKIWGSIGEEQLEWLDRLLQKCEPTLVFMHHHAVSVGVSWLDEVMLKNPGPLLSILQRAGCIKAILFGHIHFECHIQHAGLHFMSVPSLSFQLGEVNWAEKSVSLPPGFRLITIKGDEVRSVVHRLTDYELAISEKR